MKRPLLRKPAWGDLSAVAPSPRTSTSPALNNQRLAVNLFPAMFDRHGPPPAKASDVIGFINPAATIQKLQEIEDIWLRLCNSPAIAHCDVTRDCENRFVLQFLRHKNSQQFDGEPSGELAGEVRVLLATACDQDFYTWREDGRSGCFLTDIAATCNGLVLTTQTLQKLQSWPEGATLVCMMRDIVALVDRLSAVKSAGHSNAPRHPWARGSASAPIAVLLIAPSPLNDLEPQLLAQGHPEKGGNDGK
jgi:hypothetical protein